MERDGDEMSVDSDRGRQVDAIGQLMRQRGLKKY